MMFPAAAILSAAVAVSASAVLSTRDIIYQVSKFDAGCIPHSSECRYSFDVLHTNNGETTPVSCVALVLSNSGSLPDVTDAPCTNSSRTFSVARSSLGLTLAVTQPVSVASNETGAHLIPTANLIKSTTPNAEVETYQGFTSFDLSS